MDPDHQGRLAQYEGALRREDMAWRSRFDLLVHSDARAVEIGTNFVKMSFVMNAGALVALLAFVGQQWGRSDHQLLRRVLESSGYFVSGIIAAAITFGLGYLYQSALTYQFGQELATPLTNAPPDSKTTKSNWLTIALWVARALLVVVAVTSIWVFIVGALNAERAFQTSI